MPQCICRDHREALGNCCAFCLVETESPGVAVRLAGPGDPTVSASHFTIRVLALQVCATVSGFSVWVLSGFHSGHLYPLSHLTNLA